jgi:hypothetical protein
MMDQNAFENPIKENDGGTRIVKIAMLAAALIGICVLFFTAFNLFQPDRLSLIYFPSPTATLTRTPTPTPTPNLTATQQVIRSTATAQAVQTTIANASSHWSILFSDDFDNNTNHWEVGLEDGERAKTNRTITNGKYQWETTSKKGVISWRTADTMSVTDFFLTVEAEQTDGSPSSDYGLVFRVDTRSNFYYFGIDNDSFFVSLNYNDEWTDIIEWTISNAIRADKSNRLTVIAKGSHFIFLINDRYVAEMTDDRIPKGTTALAIVLHGADLQATFEFDNFEIRIP